MKTTNTKPTIPFILNPLRGLLAVLSLLSCMALSSQVSAQTIVPITSSTTTNTHVNITAGGIVYQLDPAVTLTSTGVTYAVNGGWLNASTTTENITINGTTGSRLELLNNNAGNGGAMYANHTLITGENTSIYASGNKANVSGGVFGFGGAGANVIIEGSGTFVNNRANSDSGGVIAGVGQVMFTGTNTSIVMSNNSAAYRGGAARVNSGSISFSGTSVIMENNVSGTGGGGAIHADRNITFLNSNGLVLLNGNKSGLEGGGALYSTSGSVLFAGNSITITSNTTTGAGGGVNANTGINFTNASGTVTISDNTANNNGGGLTSANNVSIAGRQVTLNNNSSNSSSGGGINSSKNVTFTGGGGDWTMIGNSATNSSGYGGVVSTATNISFSGSYNSLTVQGNRVGNSGGAMNSGGAITLGGIYGSGGILIDSNTSAAGSGGALNGGDISISATSNGSVTITNNNAGIFGGALSSNKNIVINTVSAGTLSVANNSAGNNGGAFYSGSSISITGSYGAIKINGNQATSSQGGALYAGGSITINATVTTDLQVSNNQASISSNVLKGGAFYAASDVLIQANSGGSLLFTSNTGPGYGGVIYSGGNTTISGSNRGILIDANSANNNGGAFNAAGNLTLNTVSSGTLAITNNNAGSVGGAFYSGSNTVINGSYAAILMNSNTTTLSHGGVINAAKSVSINTQTQGDLAITNNRAGGSSGGIYTQGGDITIGGSYGGSILLNSNTSAGSGGAMLANGKIFITPDAVQGISITGNTGTAASSNGGAFYASNGVEIGSTTARLGNLNISQNRAGSNAGAIYSGSNITVSGSYGSISIVNNKAGSGAGGAFYAAKDIAFNAIGDLAIRGNSAPGNGGAFNSDGNISYSGSYANMLLDSNTTTAGSGGLFSATNTITFSATVGGTLAITNNSASKNGGAFNSGGDIVLNGNYREMTIISNTAVTGGAFYSAGRISINTNTGTLSINNNKATGGKGGAFYAGTGFSIGTLSGTNQFANNKASSVANGGFLWINAGTANFDVASNGLLLLGDANSIANAADSIGGVATSNVLQSNQGTIVYYADNHNYAGDFNLNSGIAQVSSTLNLLGGKLNGSGTLAIDNANAKNGGSDFAFSVAQATGNFNGVVQLQNSSTLTTSNFGTSSPTNNLLRQSTLRLSGTGVTALASDANGGMGVLVVDQDGRDIGNLDLAGGKLVVWGKSATTAESDVLNVKQLRSTAAGSVVAADAKTLAGINSGTQWVGPIFDLSSTLSRQIVNATVGVDANVANAGQFRLVDIATGSNLTDITNYNFKNASGTADVGLIHLGYVAEVRTSGSMGIWIGTGVTQIDSTNASEMVNLNSNQSLTPGNQTLGAKLSGTGAGFNFTGGNTITLANLTGDNDYSGTSSINANTKVVAGADNSLGNTKFLAIANDGSQFDLNNHNQTIGGGLAQGANALTGGGSLTVAGGTLTTTDANSNFSANVNIGKSGTTGSVKIDNIAGIGNSGTVNFNDPAATLIVNASGTLNKQLNGQGTTQVNPNQDVAISVDNSGFSGTFALQNSSTLHASAADNLGTAAVNGSNGTLQLHGFNDSLVNDLQNNLTLRISDDSAVVINRANTQFSGSTIVDANNQLTIQNEQALNNRPITDHGLVTLDYSGNWNSVISGSGNVQTLQNISVTTAQSYTGTTLIDVGTLTANVVDAVATADMDIKSDAVFAMNNLDQSVRSLNNNGTVDFGNHGIGNFKTLTVNGNVSGNGAFKMNAAIGTDITPNHAGDIGAAGDLIKVNGAAAGDHQIIIKRNGGNSQASGSGMQLLLVQSNSSSGSFAGGTEQDIHQYSGSVDIGMRSAQVQRGDLNGANTNNWYLVLSATNTGTGDTPPPPPPPPPTPPDNGGGNNTPPPPTPPTPAPGGSGHVVLASKAARETAWFDQDTLVKRMGELRLNDGIFSDTKGHDWEAWVRSYGSQYNVGSKVTGYGSYGQTLYGVDLGADKAWNIDKRNVLYTGVFGGYERSDLDFKYNGSNGGMDGYNMGVYATWLHDTGWYADWVSRAMYMDNDFKAHDNSFNSMNGNYDGWAAGTSLEFGRQFQFKDGWYMEPQVQASYVHFFGTNYDTSGDNSFGVSVQDQDSLQIRFGSLLGRNIKLSQDANDKGFIQPYVKVFGVEQISDGGDVVTSDGRWSASLDGMSAIIGAGIIYQIDEVNQLHLDYEAQLAEKYSKPFGINFGYRHQF